MKPLQCTILATIGAVLVTFGLLWTPGAWMTPIGGLLWFVSLAIMVGHFGFPEERQDFQTIFGAFGVIALIAAIGAAAYWFYALDSIAISAFAVSLPWVIFACSPLLERPTSPLLPVIDDVQRSNPADLPAIGLMVLALASDTSALKILASAATTEAIRSPWDLVHPLFFVWMFVGTAALMGLAARSRYRHLTLFVTGLHLFTMFAPALLVYAVGYGFDPFVHVATESLIAARGAVTPKTPWYLGQYAVVTILSRLFRLPVASVDRLLVPGLASVMLPLSAVYLLRRGFKLDRSIALLSTLGLFLLPLAPFAVTTPQSLGDLFAITAAIFGASWLHDHRPALPFLLVLVSAALATHPLAGVPAAILVIFVAIFKLRRNLRLTKTLLFIVASIASVAGLPLLFAWNASRAGGSAGFSAMTSLRALADATAFLPMHLPKVETRFRPALDFAQLVADNRTFIVLLLATFGIWQLSRTRSYKRTAWAAAACGLGLLTCAFALRSGLTVAGVIGYEQQNYGDRVLETALLLLAPAVLAASAWWWRKTIASGLSLKIFAVLLSAAVTTAATYAIFPRNDAYAFSRGWSVSRHDIQAVKTVDDRAAGTPYIALANQSVSAAALQTFGFRTYYGDQYFYAIPTGGALYQSYLDMVYNGAKRATMTDTMKRYEVTRAYFILNKYWNNFAKIDAQASKTADDRYEVDGGAVVVFEYRLKSR